MIFNNIQINRLFKNKPKKAIKYLFEAYYDELCRYTYKLVEKKEIAEEIVQEIFIYLWEKRDSINFTTSPKNYLLRAAKNHSINYFKSKYTKAIQLGIEDENQEVENFGVGKNEAKELAGITKSAISSLPDRCALIFKLSRNFSMTYKEIAEHLGISVKTVEVQMTIALKRVREYLDIYWFSK